MIRIPAMVVLDQRQIHFASLIGALNRPVPIPRFRSLHNQGANQRAKHQNVAD
jgi:hypothetical protein